MLTTTSLQESIGLNLQENPYDLDINDWFAMAKRINKKRSFLFVSKRLGKHLETESHKILYASMLLSKRLNEVFVGAMDHFYWDLPEKEFVDTYVLDHYRNHKPMVFIGFAETATGLGQSVFDRFDGSLYFHTTREDVAGKASVLNFEEEHSHATSHKCFVDPSFIDNDLPVVLVDDEVTTGNTSLNIIKDIQNQYPRKEYVVVSFLNWMNEEELAKYQAYEKEQNIKIHFVYLLKGTFDRSINEQLGESSVVKTTNNETKISHVQPFSFQKEEGDYVKETGRFGLTSNEQHQWKEKLAQSVSKTNENILVLGNGELMYLPIFFAYVLGDKKVKTTTRSPIHVFPDEQYTIQSGIHFQSMDGRDIDNYLYNLNASTYERVLLLIEGKTNPALVQDFANKLTSLGTIQHVDVFTI